MTGVACPTCGAARAGPCLSRQTRRPLRRWHWARAAAEARAVEQAARRDEQNSRDAAFAEAHAEVEARRAGR